MICPSCKSEVVKITIFGNGLSQCKYCPDKYVPNPMVGMFIRHAGGINEKSRRTAAHDADISRRKLAEDGKSVIRDYGRKSFNFI